MGMLKLSPGWYVNTDAIVEVVDASFNDEVNTFLVLTQGHPRKVYGEERRVLLAWAEERAKE